MLPLSFFRPLLGRAACCIRTSLPAPGLLCSPFEFASGTALRTGGRDTAIDLKKYKLLGFFEINK